MLSASFAIPLVNKVYDNNAAKPLNYTYMFKKMNTKKIINSIDYL